MLSKDIAWLAVASLLGLKIVTGVAVAGERPLPLALTGPGTTAISQPY